MPVSARYVNWVKQHETYQVDRAACKWLWQAGLSRFVPFTLVVTKPRGRAAGIVKPC
jgi:hypothetical protein